MNKNDIKNLIIEVAWADLPLDKAKIVGSDVFEKLSEYHIFDPQNTDLDDFQFDRFLVENLICNSVRLNMPLNQATAISKNIIKSLIEKDVIAFDMSVQDVQNQPLLKTKTRG